MQCTLKFSSQNDLQQFEVMAFGHYIFHAFTELHSIILIFPSEVEVLTDESCHNCWS